MEIANETMIVHESCFNPIQDHLVTILGKTKIFSNKAVNQPSNDSSVVTFKDGTNCKETDSGVAVCAYFEPVKTYLTTATPTEDGFVQVQHFGFFPCGSPIER